MNIKMPDENCRCGVINYLTSRVPDNPTRPGQIEHLYRCPDCGWTTPFPEYKGRRINRGEDRE